MKIWQWKNWRFTVILYLSFFIMMILPVVIVANVAANQFKHVLFDNITSRTMEALKNTSASIELQIERMMYTIASIANDREVIAAASNIHKAEAQSVRLQNIRKLDHELTRYLHYNTNQVHSVQFFFKDRGTYAFKNTVGEEVVMRTLPWYRDSLEARPKIVFFGTEESGDMLSGGNRFVTAAVSPEFSHLYYQVEMIYFVFDSVLLNNLLGTREPDEDLFVLDASGSVIAARSNGESARPAFSEPLMRRALEQEQGYYMTEFEGERRVVFYLTSDRGWKYIRVLPYDKLFKPSEDIYRRTMMAATAALAVFLAFSLVLVRSITRSFRGLLQQMNRVKRGDLNARFRLTGPREVYVLGHTFNEMIARINRLMKERDEKEKQKTKAELAALQSQINPHFLLNTLNSIKIMAMISKSDNIRKMTESLMKLLSSAFNRGGTYATVEEEMKLLEHYIQIMKVRFGDGFDYRIELDSRLRPLYMLKLMLQPIVENAIIHGFQESGTGGRIRIKGEWLNDEAIRFTIEDNGFGISEEERRTLFSQKERRRKGFSGLGLKNIQQRIALHYGKPYGLEIQGKKGEGTAVSLILPVVRNADDVPKKAGDEDVQSDRGG